MTMAMPAWTRVRDVLEGDLKRRAKRLYKPAVIELARFRRRQLTSPRFIGVTGSAGKTTTKDLLYAILERQFRCVRSTDSNNELYNIARTLLTVPAGTDFCVQELGLDMPNGFIPMVSLLRPQVGIVTNIGKDHLKSFRSLEAIAAEKGRLIEGLPSSGLAVLNADDPHVIGMGERTSARVVTFSFNREADYRGEILDGGWPSPLSVRISHGTESARIDSRLFGAHQAVNVLAAVATAHSLGATFADAVAGINAHEPMLGRLSVHRTQRGVTVLRDDWKAPLWSLDAVWRLMSEARAKRKIVVLGTLSDYGGNSRTAYRRAITAALAAADQVLLVGEQGPGRAQRWRDLKPGCLHGTATAREAASWLDSFVQPGDLVLLKGSVNADHLARIALSLDQPVGCWRRHCPRQIFCDNCSLLLKPI